MDGWTDGWMDGWMDGWRDGSEAGTLCPQEGISFERETLSWEIALFPTAQLWPSRFLGCGELSQASPIFDEDAFGSAGIPAGGGGEPWASLWCLPSIRGDLSSLPPPLTPFPGKPAGSFLSSDWPL